MFNEQELIEYEKDFTQLDITNIEEQKHILEFFYTLGTIIYNN
mgnify:CR=1 FL=1